MGFFHPTCTGVLEESIVFISVCKKDISKMHFPFFNLVLVKVMQKPLENVKYPVNQELSSSSCGVDSVHFSRVNV